MTDSKLNSTDAMSHIPGVEVAQPAIPGWHHPDIDPAIFHMGMFEVRWYSLAYLAGIILGWLIIGYMNKKYDRNYLPAKAYEALPLWMVISIILGGRLGYILFYNFAYYSSNIDDIFKIWHGGMSFHGGLLGVLLGVYLFARTYKLEFLKITDLLAVVTPIGLFFGRIANFINKELVGNATGWKYGVIYPGEPFARHASQLYEAAMEGFLLFIIMIGAVKLYKALDKKGTTSGLFLIFYGVFRVISEIFRQPDAQIGYFSGHITMGQILCLPMILIGVLILLFGDRKQLNRSDN